MCARQMEGEFMGKHCLMEGELVRLVDGNIHPHMPLSHPAVVMESSFLYNNFAPPHPPTYPHSRHVFIAALLLLLLFLLKH